MTELHWALLGLAAVALLALWGYGKWQERRELARLEASLRGAVGDPLAPAAARSARLEPRLAERVEPRFGPGADDTGAPPEAPSEAPTSSSDALDGSHPEREASAYALPDGWVEDPLLDYVVELRCAHAVDGVAAIEARTQLERLQLPLSTHLAVWDARAQHWTAPDRFAFTGELLVGVQLAHRRGALGEIDAARFVSTVQQIALALDADVDLPDARHLVRQAAELDALAARFDVQIAVTLEATASPWSADVVQAAAAPAGFVPVAAGRWEQRAADGVLQLALAAPSMPTTRLALTIDVPLARPVADMLGQQYAVAEALAERLAARIVDDNGRAVTRDAHIAVAAQLAGLHEQMQAAGIEAGSPRARRLYGD